MCTASVVIVALGVAVLAYKLITAWLKRNWNEHLDW